MLINTLDSIQKLLEGEDLICKRQPPHAITVHNVQVPVEEELFVELPPDEEGREYTLRLSIQQKEMELRGETEGTSVKKESFLQLLVFFPFFVEEKSFPDLSRYLLLINKSLEFPGFGLTESDRLVYYRQVIFFPSSRVTETMLLDFIGMILMLIDSFGPNIAQIAQLEKSYSEIIKID